jgi:cytochrome c oxidase assembly factor CtaG
MLPPDAPAHVLTPGEPATAVFSWTFQPWVVVLLCLAFGLYVAGYYRLCRRNRPARAHRRGSRTRTKQLCAFSFGLLALAAALISPLDALSASLFSAHMLQHELLMIVAAPLLVLGRPLGTWIWAFPPASRRTLGQAFHARGVRRCWRWLSAPLIAWILHAIALWAWHAPSLFQAALENAPLHVLQHFTFLLSALLFWWATLEGANARAGAGHAMLSLFTTMIHTAALGALLTLAPGLWYPDYLEPTSALGFDPLHDQQLGGLIMWVPGGLAYLVGGLVVASRWLIRRVDAPLPKVPPTLPNREYP